MENTGNQSTSQHRNSLYIQFAIVIYFGFFFVFLCFEQINFDKLQITFVRVINENARAQYNNVL